jgi:hypothetical protein
MRNREEGRRKTRGGGGLGSATTSCPHVPAAINEGAKRLNPGVTRSSQSISLPVLVRNVVSWADLEKSATSEGHNHVPRASTVKAFQ